eukprot:4078928-Amphidinium_carterae.1
MEWRRSMHCMNSDELHPHIHRSLVVASCSLGKGVGDSAGTSAHIRSQQKSLILLVRYQPIESPCDQQKLPLIIGEEPGDSVSRVEQTTAGP